MWPERTTLPLSPGSPVPLWWPTAKAAVSQRMWPWSSVLVPIGTTLVSRSMLGIWSRSGAWSRFVYGRVRAWSGGITRLCAASAGPGPAATGTGSWIGLWGCGSGLGAAVGAAAGAGGASGVGVGAAT